MDDKGNSYAFNKFLTDFYSVMPRTNSYQKRLAQDSCFQHFYEELIEEHFYEELIEEPGITSFYNSGIAYGILSCQILGLEPNKDIEYET